MKIKLETALKSFNEALQKKYWIFFAVVVLIACFNLFYRLDALPVQNLDEAREGITAYEMTVSGDFIRPSFLGTIDYSNTKPPLLFWVLSLSYKIFGFNSFALRFPSALFGLITIIMTMLIAKEYYGKRASLFSGMVLSTTYAFIHFHSARKGDFDSLLAMLILFSLFFLLRSDRKKIYSVKREYPAASSGDERQNSFLAEQNTPPRESAGRCGAPQGSAPEIFYFYLSGLAVGFAFLVKSFAVIQVFGIIILYLFFSKKYREWKPKDYLLYALSFLAPVLCWAFFRFQADGLLFFKSMLENDIFVRIGKQITALPNISVWYVGVVLSQFFPWSLLLVFFLFYKNSWSVETGDHGRKKIDIRLNGFFKYSLFSIWIIVPFVLFSLANNRLDWYLVPIYPPLSILVGWFVADVMDKKKSAHGYFLGGMRMAVYVFAGLLIYEAAFVTVINDQENRSVEQRLLRDMRLNGQNHSAIFFVNRGENYGEMFVAQVIKHYRIHISSGNSDYILNGAKGDVLFLQENPDNLRFIQDNKLGILEDATGI